MMAVFSFLVAHFSAGMGFMSYLTSAFVALKITFVSAWKNKLTFA
jgi:hypothetical protein